MQNLFFNESLNDFFVILLTTVIVLNSVSIPLSYNIVADKLKPYLDRNVFAHFINEPAFRWNVWLSLIALTMFITPLTINISKLPLSRFCCKLLDNLYIGLSLLITAVFLLIFIRFSNMIYRYASDTEEVVFTQIQSEINAYLEETL